MKVVIGIEGTVSTTSARGRHIGRAIHSLRREASLTLAQLSEATGLSVPFLSQVENNRASASPKSLGAIAVALGLNADQLLGIAERGLEIDVVRAPESDAVQRDDLNQRPLIGPGHRLTASEFTPVFNRGTEETVRGYDSLLYVVAGAVEVTAAGVEHVLCLGDSIFSSAGVPYQWRAIEPGSRLIEVGVEDTPRRPAPPTLHSARASAKKVAGTLDT